KSALHAVIDNKPLINLHPTTFSSKIKRHPTLAAIGLALVVFCHLFVVDANSSVCRNCMPLFSCLPKNRNCPFCDPTQITERIVYEDDEIIVFFDRKPAASTHLLAVPKVHIRKYYF